MNVGLAKDFFSGARLRTMSASAEGARRLAVETAGKVAGHIDVQAAKQASRAEADRAKVGTLRSFVDDRYASWALVHLRRGDVAAKRVTADFLKWLDEPLGTFNV